MKILTLCSNPFVSLKPVTQLLQVAGLPEGLNSLEENKSYDQWHEQVFDAYEQDCSGLHMSQPLAPGKVWQDMAGQLIQANLSKKQWYWTDSRAGWLLDFWLEIEPQHRFALIYSPPQIGISQCLLQVDEQNASIEIAIKSWINYHFELLRFYRRHQDKCILVNLQRCLSYPSEFLQICKQHLGLDIDEQVNLESFQELSESSGIEELLFQLVVKQYPEITNLFQELEASATPLESQIDEQSVTPLSGNGRLTHICQDYRNLKNREASDAKENAQLQQDLETHRRAFEKLASEKGREIAELQRSKKKSEDATLALDKENELVLLQLHQVQEELESSFLKAQKLASEKGQEISVLQISMKKLESLKVSLEKQKEKENKALQESLKSLKKEHRLTSLEVTQVQENFAALHSKIKELEKQKIEEKQVLQAEIKNCEQKSVVCEQENELTVLQLHQVQEELEHYFLKFQALESNRQSNNVIACIEQQQEGAATSPVQAQFIQVKNEVEGFGVDLINLQWQDQVWSKYHLQIIKPTLIGEKIVIPAAIKLPLQADNLLPIKTWPPQTADEQGAYWMIDESLLSIEQLHSHFYPEDIAFLHALACQLLEWLKFLESSTGIKNNQWEDYFQVIEGLQTSLKLVFKLQES